MGSVGTSERQDSPQSQLQKRSDSTDLEPPKLEFLCGTLNGNCFKLGCSPEPRAPTLDFQAWVMASN